MVTLHAVPEQLLAAVPGAPPFRLHAVVLPLHMFWLKEMGKLPKVTLYAYLFKPNPPNSAK